MDLLAEQIKLALAAVYSIEDQALFDAYCEGLAAGIKAGLAADLVVTTVTQSGPTQGTISWNS